MTKHKVGIVCGGYSSEYKISMKSGQTVFDALSPEDWDCYYILIRPEAWTAKDHAGNTYTLSRGDFALQGENGTVRLDVIFNAIHGAPGENGQLAALWELLNIPFSSCDSYAAALTFNKRDCLTLLREKNIPTAQHYELNQNDPIHLHQIIETVGLPCFVKANRSGSSFGVYKVDHKEDLLEAIEKAFEEDSQLIIESALDGVEINVGVGPWNNSLQVFPMTEIQTQNAFFDYKAKYEGEAEEITPARISEEATAQIASLAKKIYTTLGLRGIVRSEFILVDKTPYFLEVNTIPGLTAQSIVPQQLAVAGISLADFFDALLKNTLKKN